MMTSPNGKHPARLLFVFAELGVGGEETELRLLAKHLDPVRFRIDALSCFHRERTPYRTQDELEALGVSVDRTAHALSFADTIAYLARKIPAYDVVVSCQNVADIYPALERLHLCPPLVERGRSVREALAGPKHLTTRYAAAARAIRDAAARNMGSRRRDAVEIPAMVDLGEFAAGSREQARQALGWSADDVLIGTFERPGREAQAEDFLEAAAQVSDSRPGLGFVILGGDASDHGRRRRLTALAAERGLSGRVRFLADRKDAAAVMAALDVFACLPREEGMRHAALEAGAAGLALVASAESGAREWITDGAQGLIVPSGAPKAAALAFSRLADDAMLRRSLGRALRRRVQEHHAAPVVARRWEALFDEVIGERRAQSPRPALFKSFFQGGFECSTHHRRTPDGPLRLDMIAAIGHDANAEGDYRQLGEHGLRTARDGLRWHLIEPAPGRYDWSSFLPMLRAARRAGAEVVWDVLHYGWPNDLDIWKPEFVTRFARFARETARIVRSETDGSAFYCPVNEISFLAWGGGDVGILNPHHHDRGFELKAQLVRASIAAMDEILAVDPGARFVHCDPAVNIIRNPDRPDEHAAADTYHELQFQSWDMLAGRIWPQLGGNPRYLDVLGVNYYVHNQWFYHGETLDLDHPQYKPFNRILVELFARFGRPILIAETGIEAERRPEWLAYVGAEVRRAMEAGVPVEGICLYPVSNHPGWEDDRDCPNGLFSAQVASGRREVCRPLADELARQQDAFHRLWSAPPPTERRFACAG